MRKRFLSALLVVCMILAMVPTKVLAAKDTDHVEPQVTHLTVSYDGGEPIEILKTQPTISLPTGSKPVFTVTFDNNALLNKVFVTSTKDGETKYLEAIRHGDQYITDDYFDPDNTDYIPGAIAVTYSKRAVEVTNRTQIGEISLAEMKQELETQGASVNGEITKGNDGSVNAQVVLGSYFTGIGEKIVDASIKELSSSAGIDSDEVRQWSDVYEDLSSYALKGEDGKDYMLYFTNKDWTDANSYVMLVHDISGNKYVQMALKGFNLKETAEKMSQANKLVGAYLDYVAIGEEMDSLREEIEANPMMDSSQKAEANKQIDALENDKKLVMMGVTFIPFFLGAVGVSAPLIFTALLAGYSSTADYFWERRIGMIKGCEPIQDAFVKGEDYPDHPGWTALTSRYLRDREYIITESGSYYIAENSLSFQIDSSCSVRLCTHNHSTRKIVVRNNATLYMYDCAYKGSDDNPNFDGKIGNVTIESGGKVILEKGIIGNVTTKGTFTFESGIVQSGIKIESDGEFILEKGIVQDRITNTGGKIIINGGVVDNIYDVSGDIIINGGTLESIWVNNYTKIVFNEGTIKGSSKTHEEDIKEAIWGITNNNVNCADVEINNGTVEGSIRIGNGEISINGGTTLGDISNNAGKIKVAGGTHTGNIYTNSLVLTAGNIAGDVFAFTSGLIAGGTIDGKLTTASGSETKIVGGTISGGINCYYDDRMEISGGKVYGGIIMTGTAQLVIYRGMISGGIVNNSYSTTTLCITKDSSIQVIGSSAFNKTPSVESNSAYIGDVTYYNAPDGQGVKMTIQEAANIDYTQPYVRLVADDAADGPDSGQEPETPDVSGKYTISYNANGGAGKMDSDIVERDMPFALPVCTFTAPTGKEFKAWSISGREYAPGDIYTVTGNTVIRAVWREKTAQNEGPVFTIRASAGRNGRITPSGSVRVTKGESKMFQIIPNSGYRVENVTVDGIAKDMDNMDYYTFGKVEDGNVYYLFSNVTENHTISVKFAEKDGKPNHPGGTSSSSNDGDSKPSKNPNAVKTTPEAPSAPAQSFADAPNDYWAKDAIDWASTNGYMSGYGDGSFRPTNQVTRQQLWMVLGRLAGAAPANMAAAKDWAVSSGVSDGSNPSHDMSRQQMVTILYRYTQLMGYELAGSADLAGYPDYGSVAGYAKDAMAWAVANGIIGGTSDGRLNPVGSATRAQFVVILQRFYNRVVNE